MSSFADDTALAVASWEPNLEAAMRSGIWSRIKVGTRSTRDSIGAKPIRPVDRGYLLQLLLQDGSGLRYDVRASLWLPFEIGPGRKIDRVEPEGKASSVTA